MLLFLAIWFAFGALALGPPAFIFLYMKHKSNASWPTRVDYAYKPKVSIIIPTYNEAGIIRYKLENSSKLTYPKDLVQIVIVDSNSADDTVRIIRDFSENKKDVNIKLMVESERHGKSQALNEALTCCNGDVIIISDADCFWPSDILEKAVPYLADPSVGAIGGPKILFNSKQTWITRMEERYLKSANYLRVGESKAGSTVFLEGGFSAFRKEALKKFDPYATGSDDCGTIIGLIENNYRAMLVKEAKFYSSFPTTFQGKISIKLRRINQLIRVFAKYLDLLAKKKVKSTKSIVVPNTLLYLVSPIAFVVFSALTLYLVVSYPLLLIFSLLLLAPQVRFYIYQILENNILLFVSIFAILFGQKFSLWSKPDDRVWLTAENLSSYHLI
jgi:cellulose synthase/poly-beta-1,6-N-acetylglucosamine synthase-like glycosyltransferase